MRTRLWAILVTFLTIFSTINVGAVVSASPETFGVTSRINLADEDVQNAIQKLEHYLVRSKDGTFALKVDAHGAGIDSVTYAQITSGMDEINKHIRSGLLKSLPDNSVVVSSPDVHIDSARLQVFWWGWRPSLDSGTTHRIIAAMSVGGGAAAITAILLAEGIVTAPGALLAGIVSGLLWIGSGVLSWAVVH